MKISCNQLYCYLGHEQRATKTWIIPVVALNSVFFENSQVIMHPNGNYRCNKLHLTTPLVAMQFPLKLVRSYDPRRLPLEDHLRDKVIRRSDFVQKNPDFNPPILLLVLLHLLLRVFIINNSLYL